MSEVLPPGMIPLHMALAKIAEANLTEEWLGASAQERQLLTGPEFPRSFASQMAVKRSHVASSAYERLRPVLIGGTLPAALRMEVGFPRQISAISWSAEAADRLDNVLAGRAAFLLEDQTVAAGIVLVVNADLAAILRGEPVTKKVVVEEFQLIPKLSASQNAGAKPGRRHKIGLDQFWIEVCRKIHEEGLPAVDAEFTRDMAQWSQDHLGKRGYGEETIRSKIRTLLTVLRR